MELTSTRKTLDIAKKSQSSTPQESLDYRIVVDSLHQNKVQDIFVNGTLKNGVIVQNDYDLGELEAKINIVNKIDFTDERYANIKGKKLPIFSENLNQENNSNKNTSVVENDYLFLKKIQPEEKNTSMLKDTANINTDHYLESNSKTKEPITYENNKSMNKPRAKSLNFYKSINQVEPSSL